jgi:Asp/Glu/hydantoin racemase
MVRFNQVWLRSGCDFMIWAAKPRENPAIMMTIGMLDSVLATALMTRKFTIVTAIGNSISFLSSSARK